MPRLRSLAALVLLTFLSVSIAAAQIPRGIKKKVKERVERAQDRAVDRALDVAEGAVECAVTDQACIDEAERSGQPVVVTDQQGQPLPAEQQRPGSQPPGTGAWVNYDFVPGTRPLFVDDFTKDNVGDFPRRLEFVDGNMEIAEWQGARYLRVTALPGRLAIVLPEPLPEQFTIEFDAASGYIGSYIDFKFADQAPDYVQFRLHQGKGQGGVSGPSRQTLGMTARPIAANELFRGRIMADGRYVKVYMNDTRVANIPNADIGRSHKIALAIPGSEDDPTFFGTIRVMAGGKKLYDALAEKGRVATQGIYFATGRDLLRPESTPVLKEIAAMLQEHPELKLVIEGHTDNVGDDAANLTLSDKRAAAVMKHLVERAGIDASRLEAKGFGESKPVGSNDTPEGRQQNRRVELVRR